MKIWCAPISGVITTLAAVLLSIQATTAWGDVDFDGSLGPVKTLLGPHYQITAEDGQQIGSNLFHSFGRFSLLQGESATFSGPSSVVHVLGRVTGGDPSSIDGILRTEFPGSATPSLWLINPAGVIFGENAQLAVQGSFHASTADYIDLKDTGRFDAALTESSLLTSAPPVAFGFLGDSLASIGVQGKLGVADGETLSLVAGNIDIDAGGLIAAAGKINIASVASAGDVELSDTGLDVSSFAALGEIALTQAGVVDVGGQGGGRVVIRGGRLVIDNATISADIDSGQSSGGEINLALREEVIVTNRGAIQSLNTAIDSKTNSADIILSTGHLHMSGRASIDVSTDGPGMGGNIELDADSVILEGNRTKLSARANGEELGSGNAGGVTLEVGHLEIKDRARINVTTEGPGKGGNIKIAAHTMVLDNGAFLRANSDSELPGSGDGGDIALKVMTGLDIKNESQISTRTAGSGNGGNIELKGGRLEISGGSRINANTDGSGRGGNIDVAVQELLLDGKAALLAGAGGDGDAGSIIVTVFGGLRLMGDARFSGTTSGSGKGASLLIEVETLSIEEGGMFSRASKGASGEGGDITLMADLVEMKNGARIRANTLGMGKGGEITVQAREIKLTDNALISVESDDTGDAGSLTISARDTFKLSDSTVTTQAAMADGGDIVIEVGELVDLLDSAIVTSVGTGEGNGGNITIDPEFVILDSSLIQANAFGGAGGNIRIVADQFIASPGSRVEASSQLGIDGRVVVEAPDTDLSGGISALQTPFLDATDLLSRRCSARTTTTLSSFVVVGRGGIPPGPDTAILGSYIKRQPTTLSETPNAGTGRRSDRGRPIIFKGPQRVGACVP